MHAWHVRRPTDLPVAGRSLVIELRVRRLVCQTTACPQRTFRQHDTIPPAGEHLTAFAAVTPDKPAVRTHDNHLHAEVEPWRSTP